MSSNPWQGMYIEAARNSGYYVRPLSGPGYEAPVLCAGPLAVCLTFIEEHILKHDDGVERQERAA